MLLAGIQANPDGPPSKAFGGDSQSHGDDLTVAIGSPSSAVDPQLREFKRIGVGLPLSVESAAAPAEDRDAFFFVIFKYHNGCSGDPLARFGLLGLQFDAMAAISFGAHW
jgi:hypothetical protein